MKYTREEIWEHNSFLGTVMFARKGLLRIIDSKTATMDSKIMARTITNDLDRLYKSLKVRANAN